jgi:hypothetical protein
VFVPERNLKDLILYYVKAEERSISSLTRKLESDGFRFHRLFLTGYLKALADVGVLREREIPPAKVYTTSVARSRNLYEAVGDKVRAVEGDPRRGTRLCVAVLQRLFHRPIFLREIGECGFEVTGELTAAPKDEREEIRKTLASLGLKIPSNEPAFVVEDRRNEARDQIILQVLVERFGMKELVQATTQARLSG